MDRKLGPTICEKGKANAAALREILRLHTPDDDAPTQDRDPMIDVVQDGQLLRLRPPMADLALGATGTDGDARLPYRD